VIAAGSTRAGRLLGTLRGHPFLRGVSFLTAANVVAAGLTALQGILVARWLAPESYGIAVLLIGYPAAVLAFFDAKAIEASVKYLGEFNGRGQRAHALAFCKVGSAVDALIASCALIAVIATGGWAAAQILGRADLAWLMTVYAGALLPGSLRGTGSAVLSTFGEFSTIATVELALAALRFALVVGLAYLTLSFEGVVWGNAAAVAVTGLVYAVAGSIVARRNWGDWWWRGELGRLSGRYREITRFLALNDLNSIIGMIPKQLDVVVLGYFWNPTEVGYYRLGTSLAAMPGFLVSPLQTVTFPSIARLAATDPAAMRRRVGRLATRVGLPVGVVSLVAAAVVPFAIPSLVGPAFAPAIPAAQLLLAGTSVWLGFFWLRPALVIRNRMGALVVISGATVVLLLISYALVVPAGGAVALAGTMLAAQLLSHGLATLWLVATWKPPTPVAAEDQ
jgi:O-antigen/teichoic acid export membrane protein